MENLSIVPMGELDNSVEFLNLMGRKFKRSQKALNFEEIGRKHYNPKKSTEYKKHNLEIWPGFLTSVNIIG